MGGGDDDDDEGEGGESLALVLRRSVLGLDGFVVRRFRLIVGGGGDDGDEEDVLVRRARVEGVRATSLLSTRRLVAVDLAERGGLDAVLFLGTLGRRVVVLMEVLDMVLSV